MTYLKTEPGGPVVVQKILHPENEKADFITPQAIIEHTVVDGPGDTELAPYEDREDVGSRVHFYIHSKAGSALDGQIDQLLDTTRRAAASGSADAWAIAVETEDNSAHKGSDIDALTPKAAASFIWLCNKLMSIHPTIQRRRCTSARLPGAAGVGYHSQPMRERFDGTSRNPWTAFPGKTCPGDKKVDQYNNVIMPALLSGGTVSKEWDEMASKQEVKDAVREVVVEELTNLIATLTGSAGVKPGSMNAKGKADIYDLRVATHDSVKNNDPRTDLK